jgi:DNA-binding winged helix-turn-helix (wHTH) protein
VLRFGRFVFDPETGDLRGPGRALRLRPQASRILALLASRAGELVTREELRAALWSDSTHVEFEQALDNTLWQLRGALGDTSRSPRFVETLPRRGYRFVADVTEAEAATAGSPSGGGDEAAVAPAIAVLPLQPLSEDPETRSFAEAMTDEVLTLLAQRREVRVVSHETAAAAGPGRSLADLGPLLHADLVVDGGVVLSPEHVRVNIRLVDAASDEHLWARSYEKERGDPLATQRRIAALAVDGLVGSVAERPNVARPEGPSGRR